MRQHHPKLDDATFYWRFTCVIGAFMFAQSFGDRVAATGGLSPGAVDWRFVVDETRRRDHARNGGQHDVSEFVLFHNPMSRARIAHWMLEEVGARYTVRLLNFEKGEHKSPEFLAINPMGKLPTLLHGDAVVTETAAICAYLADAFPAAGLAPLAGERDRGPYLRWLFFAAGCVEPAVVDRMMTRPEVERRSALGYGSFDDVFRTLRGVLDGGDFLLGERFTAARRVPCVAARLRQHGRCHRRLALAHGLCTALPGSPGFQTRRTQGAAMAQQMKGHH